MRSITKEIGHDTSNKKLPYTHLPVTDLDKSVDFWIEHFDCVFGDDHQPETKTALLRVENGLWLFLYETDEMPRKATWKKGALRNSDDAQIFAATLNVKDPHHLYKRLKEHGVQFGEFREVWIGHAFDCFDPDGNKFNIWGGEWKEN
ncbi:VOC family protein [Alkalihalobacillus sp. TS-13]|uniref:VOC family protein n=1 Tax=Alkalihalobacillus sp. TS-13 TaxID=2842455 RepID=UPI001C87A307|nr:VOC family protein [Alkalihalobacillus sp. TS-13]